MAAGAMTTFSSFMAGAPSFEGASLLTGPSTVLAFVLGSELLCGDWASVEESAGVGAAEESGGGAARLEP